MTGALLPLLLVSLTSGISVITRLEYRLFWSAFMSLSSKDSCWDALCWDSKGACDKSELLAGVGLSTILMADPF